MAERMLRQAQTPEEQQAVERALMLMQQRPDTQQGGNVAERTAQRMMREAQTPQARRALRALLLRVQEQPEVALPAQPSQEHALASGSSQPARQMVRRTATPQQMGSEPPLSPQEAARMRDARDMGRMDEEGASQYEASAPERFERETRMGASGPPDAWRRALDNLRRQGRSPY